MLPQKAEDEFASHLARFEATLDSMTPAVAFDAMSSFYRDVRPVDSDGNEADQDLLMVTWGTVDFGAGQCFEFEVGRQFCWGDGDQPIWQLHLNLNFQSGGDLEELDDFVGACKSLDELVGFRESVLGMEDFSAFENRIGNEVLVDLEEVD